MAEYNHSTDLRVLIQKFLDSKCTRIELERLLQLLEHDTYKQELMQLLHNHWEDSTGVKKAAQRDWESKFKSMMQGARREDLTALPMLRVRSMFRPAVIAAACLLMVICTAAYFTLNPHDKPGVSVSPTSNQAVAANDIAPGKNIAVLTLANGSTIILDSARNGTISRQGNTQVIKLNNGQVAYNSSDAQTHEITYNKISTPMGGQYEIVLPDGTKVWLNAGSSIYFPTAFTGNKRTVVLTGEGYFEVVKNPDMPFHVEANNMEVEVLGTHFNVNAYNDELAVSATLLEGSVKVTREAATGRAASSLLNKPGQQANLYKSGDITRLDEVDTDEIVAWTNGKFYFSDADVPSMMRQVARWYDVDVRYEGPITKRKFTGKIDRNINISELIILLAYAKVHVRVDGKTIVVTP